MKVAILGCGPSGLIAAHAASQRGADITIISDKVEPSKIGGGQYLHECIPELTHPDSYELVTYVKVGTEKGYALKAYGEPNKQISWDQFVTGDYPAWDLRRHYRKLWHRFGVGVVQKQVIPVDIPRLCKEYDLVFSSIPLPSLCTSEGRHRFDQQQALYTPEPLIKVRNLIVYNGRHSDPWYRSSCLFGFSVTEYGMHGHKDATQVIGSHSRNFVGFKPVGNDCDCFNEYPNFIKIGRFGKWRRGVLMNHAYEETYERIAGRPPERIATAGAEGGVRDGVS